jgi:hypothetical protein
VCVYVCVCVCVRACVHVYVCVCVRACARAQAYYTHIPLVLICAADTAIKAVVRGFQICRYKISSEIFFLYVLQVQPSKLLFVGFRSADIKPLREAAVKALSGRYYPICTYTYIRASYIYKHHIHVHTYVHHTYTNITFIRDLIGRYYEIS